MMIPYTYMTIHDHESPYTYMMKMTIHIHDDDNHT